MPPQSGIDWFEDLFGFRENLANWDATVAHFNMDDLTLVCDSAPQANKRQFVGLFTRPKVEDLLSMMMSEYERNPGYTGNITFKHEPILLASSGGINARILEPHSSGAVFQVASQFNCLEMANRTKTPQHGITIYEDDHTQGPACALACPAGTVYRNYLVKHDGPDGNETTGQNTIQIDNMSDVSGIVDNASNNYWHMENGYLISTSDDIRKLNYKLKDENFVNTLINALRVGVHWETSVVPPKTHHVCQVYASAIPCIYTDPRYPAPLNSPSLLEWEPFARLVLLAAYKATLTVAAILSVQRKQRVKCYLTTIGYGAFGNKKEWIMPAIKEALGAFSFAQIDVILVHYGRTVHSYWTNSLPEIPQPTGLLSPKVLPPPTAQTLTQAQAQLQRRGQRQSFGQAQTQARRQTQSQSQSRSIQGLASGPLEYTRIPSTLLLLGTSLVRSLLQSTNKIVPKELQVSDLTQLQSNLDNLPSLKNTTTRADLLKIDKIIDTNITDARELQRLLLQHKIGITENSIYINTQQPSSAPTEAAEFISDVHLLNLLKKINELPIFANPDVKKMLLEIDRNPSDNEVERLLKEHFNITITESRVTIKIE